MQINFRMEIMLQNAPDNMIHHLTAAQRQIYCDLSNEKSALAERLKNLMNQDGDI